MASLEAGFSIGRLRVYGPKVYDADAPMMKEREQDKCHLLLKIEHHYKEALKRLTVRWPRPSDVLLRFLDAGVCVGLLDPVSNIIVSTILAATEAPIDKASALAVLDGPKLRDAEQRSLDSLVTFLTCFFPYLADWEAIRYLLLAEADPIVAARIVIQDRGTKCFRAGSAATNGSLKLALRCTTVAAKHPCPSQLTDVWLSLCSSLDNAVSLLSAVQPNFPRNILHSFHALVKETENAPSPPPDGSLIRPWELADGRRKHTTKVTRLVTYQHSWSLRRVLLDTIHGFYLQAFARMPGGQLRSRYHRSMLKAGHCYGPFDPVSNIIVNTIWYEVFFPPLSRQDEFDSVDTWSLMRTEAQSFYGLLSFVCTCYQDLSIHQAMRILLETDLSLAVTGQCSTDQEKQEAFRAAAIAAWHPRPDAHAGFLSSCKKPAVLSLLSGRGQQQLSSESVQQLAMLLSSASHSTGILTQQQQPVSISKRRFDLTMYDGSKQRRSYERISRKIKAALRRYEQQNSGQACYQLHVVCGVNESVSGPDNSEGSITKKRKTPYGDYYHHMHANFLVIRNVGSVGSVPVLFFAELSNDDDDDQDSQLLCCPVDLPPPGAEPVRCLFCEHEGIRIVHPANREGFHGREVEFEKMVRGEDLYDNGHYPEVYSNHRILRNGELISKWTKGGAENSMYLGSNDFTIKEDDSDESENFEDE